MHDRQSLTDYAEANKLRTSSTGGGWLSTIPEFPEVLDFWKQGGSSTSIRRWLIQECGYPQDEVTESRVRGWLDRHHPRGTPT